MINPYCTVVELRDELRNTNPDVEPDLERAIVAASRWVDWRTGRDYFQHDYSASGFTVDKFDGEIHGRVLFLRYYPIVTLGDVSQNGVVLTEGQDFIRKDDRLITLGEAWSAEPPEQTITIKGVFGYAQSDPADVPTGLPQHIRIGTIMAAAALSGHNRKEIIGLDGSRVELIDRNIPETVREMLGQKIIL